MTEQEYRTAEGVNKTTLWEMRKSPAHYKYLLEHPAEDTAALHFGRALHSAILTPEAFSAEYFIAPDVDRRTKAGREQYAEWKAALPQCAEELTAEDARTIHEMADAIMANGAAADLIADTMREYPIFWDDKKLGIRCKCRIDALGKNAVVDLKTTADILTFDRDAYHYGYHVQAAHYLRGVEAETGRFLDWYFIAMEKKPPYGLKIIKATAGFIDYGDFIRDELLEQVKSCTASGEWPSYPAGEISEPHWADWGD